VTNLSEQIADAINNKTKPRGALGALEDLAARVATIQGTVTPVLAKPAILVFAADHGLAREPVSAYPREVTAQMALNILAGGAGINVFCRQHGIDVVLTDAGVDWPGDKPEGMVDHWMGPGTASSLAGDAMTADEVEGCLTAGADVVDQEVDPDSTIVGFGELGIGNTSAASLIVSALTGLPLADCVGPGTGLAGSGLAKKLELLGAVQARHPQPATGRAALAMFGGYELAQMSGAMRRAYQTGRILMIDGFVATAALLAVWRDEPGILDNAVFCHESGEPGHTRVLAFLGVKPLVSLGMRLGEGTGCAVAYPLIASAVAFLTEMASFDQAGVSTGEPEAQAA
jgi:nicotinate-nucleotide--dimethylbenzimidazole phosphoribosyltransferase